jgi:hypothetical protein
MNHAQALTWRTAYYAAQEEADRLSELEYEANKVPCPRPSVAEKAAMYDIINHYHGQKVFARFWHDGYFYSIYGRINSVSLEENLVVIEGQEILCSHLLELTDNF